MKSPDLETSQYSQNPTVVYHEDRWIGGLLFYPETRRSRVLNETGIFIWRHCSAQRDFAEIVAATSFAFEVESDTHLDAEIRCFLEELVSEGFLDHSPTNGPWRR